MKIYFLCFLCLITLFSVAEAKEITIKKLPAGNSIFIDGDDDDWPATAVWQAVDQHKGEPANKNNTVSLKMTYDDDFLYVAVKVLDGTIDTAQSTNAWEKDCIEVFFVLNDTISDGASYSTPMYGAWQLRKVYGRPMTDLPGKGFQAEETDIAGGYLQEWKLSWDTLASPSYGAYWGGKKFRFEILNQDNDGAGLNSQLFWNSNAYDQWNTIKNQGTVYLDYSPSDDLVLSTSSFNISAFFKIFSVEVYTADAWSAQSNKSWLTLENTSGEGNGTIKFSVSSNNSELSREAKITVSNGKVSKVVIVTQAGVSCSSLLAKTKLELQVARDSINMLLDKVARYDSITVAVVEMKDFTAIVKLPETNVSLKLYPNPTKDKVLVECESLISKIEIFNIKGQKVYDKISSANTSYLRLEGFKAGTYILKVHTDKGVVGGIFVIKR